MVPVLLFQASAMNLARPGYWTKKSAISIVLWPVSILFRLLAWLRRLAFQWGVLSSWQSPVPVVIVGNITVGGAGKTPLVVALSELLTDAGFSVGVVARGYGGSASASGEHPVCVDGGSNTALVGDEPVLIAKRTGVPVVVSRHRVAAVKHLLANHDVDCVLCDDGLQHYALQRDIEIVVVDAEYRFGNGFCLPAGPLREPVSRTASADFMVFSGSGDLSTAVEGERGYKLLAAEVVSIADETHRRKLSDYAGDTVHAVAGIASPDKFYQLLHSHGIKTIEHAFGDHAAFTKDDLVFDDDLPVLMTEKDMVKCTGFGLHNSWYVPVSALLDDDLASRIKLRIEQVILKRKNHVI